MNRDMAEIIRHQQPVTMAPNATVQEACKEMYERRIGAVLVVDGTQLVGIFTGRDAVKVLAEGRNAKATQLKDAMTPEPTCLPPKSKAIDALRLMRDGGFRHVPVVEEGLVVGIVARGDFRGLEKDRLDVETGYWEHMR